MGFVIDIKVPIRIETIEDLLANITQGEWCDIVDEEGNLKVVRIKEDNSIDPWTIANFGDMETSDMTDHYNARFMAVAPVIIRQLLDERKKNG